MAPLDPPPPLQCPQSPPLPPDGQAERFKVCLTPQNVKIGYCLIQKVRIPFPLFRPPFCPCNEYRYCYTR